MSFGGIGVMRRLVSRLGLVREIEGLHLETAPYRDGSCAQHRLQHPVREHTAGGSQRFAQQRAEDALERR